MTGKIVEARLLINLRRQEPENREGFKTAVVQVLKIAQQKAEILESVAGTDIDLGPYLEEIADLAEVWQRKEFERRHPGG